MRREYSSCKLCGNHFSKNANNQLYCSTSCYKQSLKMQDTKHYTVDVEKTLTYSISELARKIFLKQLKKHVERDETLKVVKVIEKLNFITVVTEDNKRFKYYNNCVENDKGQPLWWSESVF